MYVGSMGAGGGIGPGPRPGESSRVAVPGLLGASRERVARHGDPGSSEILPLVVYICILNTIQSVQYAVHTVCYRVDNVFNMT